MRAANFVTSAGGFCTALNRLLIAETEADIWTLFPGVPAEWQEVSFRDIHTRAGWKVSARQEAGQVVFVEARPSHSAAAEWLVVEILRPHPRLQSESDSARASMATPLRVRVHRSRPLQLGNLS